MAIDLIKVRAAIRPHDAVAIIITLLGFAIALFLGDAVIRFIGVAIAVLGGVALYVTVKQRMNDQVQIRARRTTLPPPAFKTRVTQDPATSTKRIVFDDFKEAFNPTGFDLDAKGDDEEEDDEKPLVKPAAKSGEAAQRPSGEQQQPATPKPAAAKPVAPKPAAPAVAASTVSAAAPAAASVKRVFDAGEDEVESEELPDIAAAPIPAAGESFRVVTPKKSGGESDGRAAEPAAAPRRQEEPAQEQSRKSEPVRPAAHAIPVAAERKEAALPHAAQQQPNSLLEPVTISAPVEEVRHERTHTRKQAQIILEELIAEGEYEGVKGEPRTEFVRLVGQLLTAVARSIQARSIIFFWVNLEKGHMIPEAQVSTGSVDIHIGARIPLGSDVLSQIARSGVPEIITDISPAAERELIPYYAAPTGTSSFVGVPVFFRREVVGVLAADSTEENGFDEGSVATLAEYTRVISGLIRGYTEKYDLHLIARTVEAFGRIHRGLTGATPTPAKVAGILVEEIGRLFDAIYVAAVLFDEQSREWRVVACEGGEVAGELKALRPDMQASLVGQATRFAEEIYLERLDGEFRFDAEESLRGSGAFLAIPLLGTTKCYGTLAMEHPFPAAYIPRDIDLIRDLVRYASMAIEVYNVNQAIESQVVVDEVTGLYNADFLLAAFDREIVRARDLKRRLSFGLITVDMPASLKAEPSGELEEIVLENVGEILTGAIRPYDTAGIFDGRTFGVVLVDKSDQDAYLWAERLRKEVASCIIAAGQRKFSVTISVGICDLSSFSTSDQVIEGAGKALDRARSGEGNAVILF